MTNRPALHDDDRVMPVFPLWRGSQAGDVTRFSALSTAPRFLGSDKVRIKEVTSSLFHEDAIDYLATTGELDVCGGLSSGCQKMFTTAYILELCNDVKWLGRATQKVRRYIQSRNTQRRLQKLAEAEARQGRSV